MANAQKYTKMQSGHLMTHYERGKDENGEYIKFGNQQIDTSRTELNYNLCPDAEHTQQERLEQRLSEVKCMKRKDVNVMCSWAITAPKNVPEEEQREFFETCHQFLNDRYGAENEISCYVHMDETTPHMHYAFVPVTRDKKKGHEKVSAKEVLTKEDLQEFHTDLQCHVNEHFGHDKYAVLNGATAGGNKTIADLKSETAQAELGKLQKSIEDYKKMDSKAFDDMMVNRKRRQDSARELKKTNDALETAQNDVKTAQAELDTINQSITQKSADLDGLQADIETAEKQLKEKNNELAAVDQELGDKKAAVEDLANIDNKIRLREKHLSNLQTRIDTLSEQAETAQNNVNTAQAELNTINDNITQKSADLDGLQADIETAQNDLSDLQTDIKTKNDELSGINKQIVDKQAEYQKILDAPPKVKVKYETKIRETIVPKEVEVEVIKEIPKNIDYKQMLMTALEAFKKLANFADNRGWLNMENHNRLCSGDGGDAYMQAHKTVFPRSKVQAMPLGDAEILNKIRDGVVVGGSR